MENKILHKYSIFEVKLHLAEMEKQYGKEAVEELIGKDRSAEIEREFKKEIALRLEPYWNDIYAYEHGGIWKKWFIEIRYVFRERRAEWNVPKHVLQAIVDDMMPDIRAFFESEEGKREFEEWKEMRKEKRKKTN
jgi:hypothetical protein